MKRRLICALAALLCLAAVGCSGLTEEEPAAGQQFLMSTSITQQVYGKEKQQAVEAVDRLLAELDQKLSLFVEGSDIDRINKNAGTAPVEVDEYTYELLRQAKRYSELSQGLFDITIAPLTQLWGIGTDHARLPAPEELAAALPLVDWRKLLLDDAARTAYLQEKGMAIDLGGVAKGYIAGAIGQEYQKYQVTGALVSIGGNICTYGKKPNGKPYVLGIRDPESSIESSIMGKLSVGEGVAATTGGYERHFTEDGVDYSHVLDPKTGHPVQSDLLSVTVICDDGGLADYLSTTLFLAGEKAIPSYRNDERFQVIVIDKERRVHISDSLRDSFELTARQPPEGGAGYTFAEDSR